LPYPAQTASPARIAGIGLVALIHVGLIYALLTGLAYRVVQVMPVAIQTRIIAPAPERKIEPPPPTPTFQPPPPAFVPPPEVNIAKPPPPPPKSTAITNVTPVAPAEPPPVAARAPPHEAVSVLPHVDIAASRTPDYPPVSRRLGEQGTVVLEVLVDAAGHAVEAKVVQSSGFPRLDAAAVEGVKRDYRFTPGTVDGQPQPMHYTFKFTWKLQ
jgi:protein TonB